MITPGEGDLLTLLFTSKQARPDLIRRRSVYNVHTHIITGAKQLLLFLFFVSNNKFGYFIYEVNRALSGIDYKYILYIYVRPQ